MTRRVSLAKISRPRLFGVVPRERLFAFLDANLGRPLIWVSGPPGAGKTALVASYLEDRGSTALWYQIDAGDADPASLFHYLALAAESRAAATSDSLPRLVPEHLSDLPRFARFFFRAFFAQLPAGFILVLDNYQDAPSDASLHQILSCAVAEVPPDSSIIAISREESPRHLVEFSAKGAMTDIGWDMLRLTYDEVCAIAARRSVTDDWLLKPLHRQSQGWVAGIILMLERLGHLDADTQELPSETRETVFNYFASLIFDQVPEHVREVLLSIAFLPQVTPSLAIDMSGREDAPSVLESFFFRRLFIDRRHGVEPVYQFHALFLDFLKSRAHALMEVDERQSLLRRSAVALEAANDLAGAMDLWIATQEWGQVTRVILNEANGLLNSGRRETLTRWIQALPQNVVAEHAWVRYWLGMAHVQTRPAHGIVVLQDALRHFRGTYNVHGQVLCLAALLNASFLDFADLAAMDESLDELLDTMADAKAFLPPDAELRVWGVLCSALFWIRPSHPWASDSTNRVEDLVTGDGDANATLSAAASALATTSMSGGFECGDRILHATKHLIDNPGASPSEAVWWLVHAGFLRFFETRYEEALEFMHRACQLAERNGMRNTCNMATSHRCAIEFRILGWTVANGTLTEIEGIRSAQYPMAEAMLYLLQARRAYFRGRCDEAADLAELSEGAATRIGSRYQEMLFGLIEAELLVAAGRMNKARALIARSQTIIGQTPVFDCWRAALVFVQAWLAQGEGDQWLAISRLREALLLAKVGKRKYYLRHFECAMTPLFIQALMEGIEMELVQELVRVFRIRAPMDAPDIWPWRVRIFTLGRFEILVDGLPVEFSRKLPRKTLLLLKAIVAQGGREVPEEVLCDAIWGDEEGDAARNAMLITIVRLRKLLGSNEAVLLQGGRVSLNRELCWVDAWAFESRLGKARNPPFEVLDLYGGTFLPGDEGEPWTVSMRERLRGKFIHALSMHGAELESKGDLASALACYQRGIDADPVVESFHIGLMRCYLALDKPTEAVSAFRRLRHTLSVLLGVPPSPEAQRLFDSILELRAGRGGAAEHGSPDDGDAGRSTLQSAGNVTNLHVNSSRRR